MIRKALVYLQVENHEGLQRLQQKIFNLRKAGQIQNASSVYRRHSGYTQKEQIEVVLEILGADQKILDNGMAENGWEVLSQELLAQDCLLLAVEGEMRVDPKLPLPHPILLLDPFILKIAAECSPYWEHCVKHETLQALSNQNSADDPVEFLTQGKALINVLA